MVPACCACQPPPHSLESWAAQVRRACTTWRCPTWNGASCTLCSCQTRQILPWTLPCSARCAGARCCAGAQLAAHLTHCCCRRACMSCCRLASCTSTRPCWPPARGDCPSQRRTDAAGRQWQCLRCACVIVGSVVGQEILIGSRPRHDTWSDHLRELSSGLAMPPPQAASATNTPHTGSAAGHEPGTDTAGQAAQRRAVAAAAIGQQPSLPPTGLSWPWTWPWGPPAPCGAASACSCTAGATLRAACLSGYTKQTLSRARSSWVWLPTAGSARRSLRLPCSL